MCASVRVCAAAQGDTADWAWMVISTLVLVWFSAGLYRIYAHLYYAAGLHTFAEMMAR